MAKRTNRDEAKDSQADELFSFTRDNRRPDTSMVGHLEGILFSAFIKDQVFDVAKITTAAGVGELDLVEAAEWLLRNDATRVWIQEHGRNVQVSDLAAISTREPSQPPNKEPDDEEQLHGFLARSAVPNGLTDEQQRVMEVLLRKKPAAVLQADMETDLGLHKNTIRKALGGLRESKLAHRPNGERKGWALTALGTTVAESLYAAG